MKAISQKEFQKAIAHMYGNTTCFVYDEPSNRYQYVSGEINDDSLNPFLEADRIEVEELEDNSGVAAVMIENWSKEFSPANDVQDDNYVITIRNIFGENSKLYVATKDEDTTQYVTYLLTY